jgi:hypothetical protein
MTSNRSRVERMKALPSATMSSARGSAKPGVVALANLDNLAVDLAQPSLADRVAQNFPQGAAVAAADDQDVERPPVERQGRVNQHLVVEEFIRVRRLDEAVQEQNPSEGLVADELDFLEGRAAPVERSLDFEKDAVPGGLVFAGFLHDDHLGLGTDYT